MNLHSVHRSRLKWQTSAHSAYSKPSSCFLNLPTPDGAVSVMCLPNPVDGSCINALLPRRPHAGSPWPKHCVKSILLFKQTHSPSDGSNETFGAFSGVNLHLKTIYSYLDLVNIRKASRTSDERAQYRCKTSFEHLISKVTLLITFRS